MRRGLDAQLFSLNQDNRVKIKWYPCQTLPGSNWKHEKSRHLNTSNVIVLLVSQHFINSIDGWYIGERAMKLYNAGKARVVPVKLRQIDNWEATPFRDLKYLPSNGEPVDNRFWLNHNAAFVDIAQGIREVVEEEQEQRHRQFNIAEQAAIFAPINSLISNQFFQRIILFPNISARSVPIAVGVLAVTALAFYNFSAKNPAESFFNQGKKKSEKSYSQQNQAKNSLIRKEKKRNGNI
jgi:hypothetical protein